MSEADIVDACVVGSGAGGSVVAATLAAAGYKVVVLESGEETRRGHIPTARDDWEQHLMDYFPPPSGRDRIGYHEDGDPRFGISRFKGVGGSTMHFEGFYLRLHPDDLRRRSQLGLGADWPLGYDELVPRYDAVEARLGVSGTRDNPFEPPRRPYPNPPLAMSCAVQQVKRGCDALGLAAAHAPMAILSRASAGRGACNFCGGCWSGCLHRAISNAAETYLADALAAGAELRTRATASRILLHADGRRVSGVEYVDGERALQRQRARRVVVCGNGVETPRLLLLSAQAGHPDGLGNGSGLVGRYFTAHSHVSISARFEHRVDAYKGPNINGMVQDFWDHRDDRDFAGGYLIALRNAELGPYYQYRRRLARHALFGDALYDALDRNFGHTATISAYGEHFATADDRIDLHPTHQDSLGLPIARVRIRHGDNEQVMRDHMRTTLVDIMQAAGAERVADEGAAPILGTHLMGTCRMGTDPADSVVDADGRSHEVDGLYIADGSLFPTSTPANPTLTLQAMALRIAERMVERDRREGG